MADQTLVAGKTKTEELKSGARNAKAGADILAEEAARRTPSLLFPIAALASIAVSATLQSRGNRQLSLFIGQWAPSFLLFGLYSKVIKSWGAA